MKSFLFYGLVIESWLLGLLLTGSVLFAFDPGTGPGNINATNEVAYVSQTYTFTDGCYARGAVYFKDGFRVTPHAKVTLGIFPPVEGGSIDVDVTATVLLEQPLWLRTVGWFMKGTFMPAPMAYAPVIIAEMDNWNGTTRPSGHAFFPITTTIDFKGSIFTTEPYRYCIYLGDATTGNGTLVIKNARMTTADSAVSSYPDVYRLEGPPAIQSAGSASDPSFIPSTLYFDNTILEVVEQLTLNNMFVYFKGNCFVRNANPIDPSAVMPGAKRAKLRFGTTVPMNLYIMLEGPSNCIVGPEVDLYIGDLGQPLVEYGSLTPYGGFAINEFYSGFPLDVSLTLLDACLTVSRSCLIEGGLQLGVQGSCGLFSTATDARDRVLTFGRTFISGSGDIPIDAVLDIQPASVLNVHNMVLNNNNNP